MTLKSWAMALELVEFLIVVFYIRCHRRDMLSFGNFVNITQLKLSLGWNTVINFKVTENRYGSSFYRIGLSSNFTFKKR